MVSEVETQVGLHYVNPDRRGRALASEHECPDGGHLLASNTQKPGHYCLPVSLT